MNTFLNISVYLDGRLFYTLIGERSYKKARESGQKFPIPHLTRSACTSKVFERNSLGRTLLINTRKVPFRILQLITHWKGWFNVQFIYKLQTEIIETMTFSHNKRRAYPHQIGRRFYEMKLRIVRGPDRLEVQS